MQMFPAYKPLDVMSEYAITFFSLLNEGYRQKYKHYQMLVQIISVPHMEDKVRKQFVKNLEFASSDADDILKTDTGTPNATEALKDIFRKS